jgi:hypothetical protein
MSSHHLYNLMLWIWGIPEFLATVVFSCVCYDCGHGGVGQWVWEEGLFAGVQKDLSPVTRISTGKKEQSWNYTVELDPGGKLDQRPAVSMFDMKF